MTLSKAEILSWLDDLGIDIENLRNDFVKRTKQLDAFLADIKREVEELEAEDLE